MRANLPRYAGAAKKTLDLNRWHHTLHQVTGDMVLRFNGATAADLVQWAKMLRTVVAEMEAAAARPLSP